MKICLWKKTPTSALGLLAMLLLFWETAVYITGIQPWFLPAPSQVFVALVETFPLLLEHSKATLLAATTGLSTAILVALALAALMELSPRIRQAVYPLLIISQTVPIITIAPLLVIWFGFGLFPKVVVVALVCFFPVAVSMVEGMRAADPDAVNLLRVMGSSRWQVIRLVRFPAALPPLFAGLRIACTYAVMGAVIGEWTGASKGLGVFMFRASHAYQADRVLAAVVIITAASLLLFALVELTARLVMPWYYNEKRNKNA